MSGSDDYDLTGIRAAEIFRELPQGIRLNMSDGSVTEVVGNPGDGAWLLVKYVEDTENPERVGEEEHIFYADVTSVISPNEDGAQ
jgi:hypothetical protein